MALQSSEAGTERGVLRALVGVLVVVALGGGGVWAVRFARQYSQRSAQEAAHEKDQRTAARLSEEARQLLLSTQLATYSSLGASPSSTLLQVQSGQRAALGALLKSRQLGLADTTTRLLLPYVEERLGRELAVAWGPREPDLMQFSPDSRLLAIVDGNHGVSLVALSPTLATLGNTRLVTPLDSAARKLRQTQRLTGAMQGVAELVFSPDSQRILVVAKEGACRLYTTASGQLLANLGDPATNGQPPSVLVQCHMSADGRRLFALSQDLVPRLFDGLTGRAVAVLKLPPKPPGELPVSTELGRDGRRIVVAMGNSAQLFSLEDGAQVATLRGHTAPIRSVAFAPDGTRLVTTSGDQTARLWNSETGQLMAVLEGHTAAVYSATFTFANGRAILTVAADGTARLWDSQTGASLFPPVTYPRLIDVVTSSQDGSRMIVRGDGGALELWDRILGTSKTTLLPAPQKGASAIDLSADAVIAFSPSGKRLATGTTDGLVRLWDGRSGHPLRVLAGHQARVSAVAFNQAGQLLASASRDGMIRLWHVRSDSFPAPLPAHAAEITALAFSPDGAHILSASKIGSAQLTSLQTLDTVHVLEGPRRPIDAVMFTHTGRHAVTISAGGHGYAGRVPALVRFFNVQTGLEERRFGDEIERGRVLAVAPDGLHLVTSSLSLSPQSHPEGKPQLYELSTPPRLIATLPGHAAPIEVAAFSPDGALVATAGDDLFINLYEAKSGAFLRKLDGHTAPVRALAFSPDGKWLLSGAQDRTARLFDTVSAALLHTYGSQTGTVRGVYFSPSGQRVLSLDSGLKVWLWGTQAGELLGALSSSTGNVPTAESGGLRSTMSVAFSPDSTRIATAGEDLRIFDGATGKPILIHGALSASARVDDALTAVAFSPDGRFLLSGSQAGGLKLWDVQLDARSSEELLQQAAPLVQPLDADEKAP